MPTVLIVDDEPDILVLLRLALQAAGYSTAEATDGEEALRVIRDRTPDVVLLDIMMPVMDGWVTLERLQESEQHPPVIMVTARTASRDRDRAMELGAEDFVTKPFEPADLLERMRHVLDSRGFGRRTTAAPDPEPSAPTPG
ncbi:MAG: response regulator transcription factor [Actinomycetota bacterium]